MLDPQMMNAIKIAGVAILLLILVKAVPLLGIIALIVGVPLMLYWAFWSPDAPFPKPWRNPFK